MRLSPCRTDESDRNRTEKGQATFPGEEKGVRINFAARGEDLVQLVHLVCDGFFGLSGSENEINEINQIDQIN